MLLNYNAINIRKKKVVNAPRGDAACSMSKDSIIMFNSRKAEETPHTGTRRTETDRDRIRSVSV